MANNNKKNHRLFAFRLLVSFRTYRILIFVCEVDKKKYPTGTSA
jgi:hypothetical protein